MPEYKVEINGQNFLIDMDGQPVKCGFFTHRFVVANDSTEAESAAVEVIRKTQRLRDLVRNGPDDPPIMDVTSITELESSEAVGNREPGFVCYEESPKRWWQFWRR
jgi:hypothetical protein